jgi:hypothetical protein
MHGMGRHRRHLDPEQRRPHVRVLGQTPALDLPASPVGTLNFVQISDSHIGFSKPANKDVAATFREAVSRINAMPIAPEFLIHTGTSPIWPRTMSSTASRRC